MTEIGNSHKDYSSVVFKRYLAILGISISEPNWQSLAKLTSAHLIRIPFENASKIYRARIQGIHNMPSIEDYLDGIERFNFGGTCFVNNYYLHLLLDYLGYEVKLCGADVLENEAPPDGHIANVVTIGGHEVIVDVGFGAPFWHPIPRDSETDITIHLGSLRYILKPKDKEGLSRLEIYRDGQLLLGYALKPAARKLDDFAEVITRSYDDSAPLLNYLLIVRFFADGVARLRNNAITEVHGSESRSQKLATKDEIKNAIVDHFSMPANITRTVIDLLSGLKTFWL
jgi:N-hydroxyarylamine O-acetyltransferase